MMIFQTRYLPATDTLGSRIQVKTEHSRLRPSIRNTFGYDYAASDAHEAAVRELLGALWPETVWDVQCVGQLTRGYKFAVTAAVSS